MLSGLATTLALALATEWVSSHVRGASLSVAEWASERLKGLRAEPIVYLHLPRILGYVVAPVAVWALIGFAIVKVL